MGIRKLLLETVIVLALVTCSIIIVNSIQTHYNAAKNFTTLQEQYFDATYEIYQDEIIGNLLIDNPKIESTLLEEIANRRKIGLKISYLGKSIQTSNVIKHLPLRSYKLELGNGKTATLDLFPINNKKLPWVFSQLLIPLFLEALVLGSGFAYLLWRFSKSLLLPLADLVSNLKPGYLEMYTPKPESIIELKELSDTLKLMNLEIQKKALFEAEANAARYVAHDIRSPLASLTLLLSHASVLPEQLRTLMRDAIQRISDIANSLHTRAEKLNKYESSVNKIESHMIASLVEPLISEKRMQLRDKKNVCISADLEKSYGLFTQIDPVEFKRVLSNLINNSLEAFDDQLPHRVHLTVNKIEQWIQIQVQDDGKGIPAKLLNKVGQYGLSYGKETVPNSGTGLGLYYTIKTIEIFGGVFAIHSKIYQGTTATIKLPQSAIPIWFVQEIRLAPLQKIIILDDDPSIHHLWQARFEYFRNKNIELLYFSSANQFRNYYLETLKPASDKVLFLIDFELLNQNLTGLDLIAELHLEKQAILITSHYENAPIKERVTQMGVRMIPKGMAAFVPITWEGL